MLFDAGQVVATRQALSHLFSHGLEPLDLLFRHLAGDFGDLCEQDKKVNELAILHGARILSAYIVGEAKLYVITEADRSVTTVLMASEY